MLDQPLPGSRHLCVAVDCDLWRQSKRLHLLRHTGTSRRSPVYGEPESRRLCRVPGPESACGEPADLVPVPPPGTAAGLSSVTAPCPGRPGRPGRPSRAPWSSWSSRRSELAGESHDAGQPGDEGPSRNPSRRRARTSLDHAPHRAPLRSAAGSAYRECRHLERDPNVSDPPWSADLDRSGGCHPRTAEGHRLNRRALARLPLGIGATTCRRAIRVHSRSSGRHTIRSRRPR
jgi:hypothetical protein